LIASAQREKIRNIIQDCNLNFLIGSGLSCPYLNTLGSIETLLTALESIEMIDPLKKNTIKCSLYKHYFDGAMAKNLNILKPDALVNQVLQPYIDFLKRINSILLKRKSSILGKGANIFTTNIDVFLEKALEDIGLEYNDGFNGRFTPSFSLSNFNKSRFKRSLHFDNISELPVFNLLKMHGSLTWILDDAERIVFSHDLDHVKQAMEAIASTTGLLAIDKDTSIDKLLEAANASKEETSAKAFLEAYDKLLVVNPTKEKFKHTLLNYTYYELLRIYSNELEKDNSVLFVMGFSFADEHIREITLRAANSNPTLMIYVIAHSSNAVESIRGQFAKDSIKNANIDIIGPTKGENGDEVAYDLPTINRDIFGKPFEDIIEPESPTTEAQEQ